MSSREGESALSEELEGLKEGCDAKKRRVITVSRGRLAVQIDEMV